MILLRAKMYFMQYLEHDLGIKRAKGISRHLVASTSRDTNDISCHQLYDHSLLAAPHRKAVTFRKHGLSAWEDKRCWLDLKSSFPTVLVCMAILHGVARFSHSIFLQRPTPLEARRHCFSLGMAPYFRCRRETCRTCGLLQTYSTLFCFETVLLRLAGRSRFILAFVIIFVSSVKRSATLTGEVDSFIHSTDIAAFPHIFTCTSVFSDETRSRTSTRNPNIAMESGISKMTSKYGSSSRART